MKTMDELPEQYTHAQIREHKQDSWWNGNQPPQGSNKSGNAASPVPSQPGGEHISKAELADYSNRPDRNYAGAGHHVPAETHFEPGNLPRESPEAAGLPRAQAEARNPTPPR